MDTAITCVSHSPAEISGAVRDPIFDPGYLAGQLAASSQAIYAHDVSAYLAYCEAQGLDRLEPQTLTAWRDHLVAQTQLSPHTINRMLSAVKRLVKEGAAREKVPVALSLAFSAIAGVKVRALKARLKQGRRTRIAAEDMRRLCNLPDTATLIGLRDRALLHTLATSGIRASELATLTCASIEQRKQGYLLSVLGKTDDEPRTALLSEEAKQAIDAWLAVRPFHCPYVFTAFTTRAARPLEHPLSEAAVWLIVQKYAAAAGLEHVKPHDFRRFVGTQLAAKDIRQAQKALGHKSIETTARHYVLDELQPGLTDHLY